TQPFLRSSFSPNAFADPRNCLPSSKTGAFVSSLTVLHQSMLLTKTRFASGEKAGPFHSTPPPVPGQKKVPSGDSGTSALTILVTGVFQATDLLSMSIAWR